MNEPGRVLSQDDSGMLHVLSRFSDTLPVIQRAARRAAIDSATAADEGVTPLLIDISATLEKIYSGSPYLSSLVEGRCKAVRDLFAGTPDAGTVILTCGKPHHMHVHAHRMTNPDGGVTTWRL